MSAPVLAIREVGATVRAVRLRLPFRFGDVTVTEAREVYLTVAADTPAGPLTGRAAQLMVPRWFDKRPDQSAADTVRTLARSVRLAAADATGARGTVAALSRRLRDAVRAEMADAPALAAGFGPALAEAALVDLAARAAGLSFAGAARADAFGLAGETPPDLEPAALRAFLADLRPARALSIRHTVGYDAPLQPEPDLAAAAPPSALADVIARHGVRAFKIKLKGDPEADLARLRAVAAVIGAPPGLTVTLDGNEQYAPDALPSLLEGLDRDPALAALRAATAFIEQPLDRAATFAGPAPASPIPLLLDEADDAEDAFPRALALGWGGVSVKSCKGVLRALLNGARARAAGARLSAEDLTCQPGLAWAQDAAMAAALGLSDAERNGHHFAGGMQGATGAERSAFAAAYPRTFTPAGGLLIEAGRVDVGAIVDAPGLAGAATPDTADDPPLTEESSQ